MNEKLRDAILTLTGLDIETNKALKKYAKSGMTGLMQDIYDTLADTNVDDASRQAMAVLVYNRRANGSKIPGVPYLSEYDAFAKGWPPYIFMEDVTYRLAAFKEVKPETLSKYRVAIYLIDKEKARNEQNIA